MRLAYGNRCAISGLKLINGGGRPEVQAAHIKPVASAGPDSVRNGLALSGTLHWMFDRGLISVDDDFRILRSGGVPEDVARLIRPEATLLVPGDEALRPHPSFLRLAYQLPPSAPLIRETGSGSWPTPTAVEGKRGNKPPRPWDTGVPLAQRVAQRMWPTPSACVANLGEGTETWLERRERVKKTAQNGNGMGMPLTIAVKLWPTPTRVTATGGAALCKWGGSGARAKLHTMVTPEELNGALNPTWVEWLMGFPLGWTDLEPSETLSSRKSSKSSGEPSSPQPSEVVA